MIAPSRLERPLPRLDPTGRSGASGTRARRPEARMEYATLALLMSLIWIFWLLYYEL